MKGPSRFAAVLIAALPLVFALFGCAETSASGDLGANQKILASCPTTPPAGQVSIDVSGSIRGQTLPEVYAAATRAQVRRTAVCGGHLRVVAFSASSAATVSLFDGDLKMSGSTDTARLRHVPQATDETMKIISDAYSHKLGNLAPGGTDIVAQYRVAAESLQQVGEDRPLDLLILTDGFQTAGTVVGDRVLSDAEAKSLAAQFDVPQLPGASITVAGIGKTGDQAAISTDVINGMKAFYDAICQRTRAGKCTSVTDYTPAGS